MGKKVSSSLLMIGRASVSRKDGSLGKFRKWLSVYSPNCVGIFSRVKYPARTRKENPSVRALLGASRWVWMLRSRYFILIKDPKGLKDFSVPGLFFFFLSG